MAEEKLSDSYHRARRMFALLCGILIVWEYVGIEVGGDVVDKDRSRDTTTQVDSAVVSDSHAGFEAAGYTIDQQTDSTSARLDSKPLDSSDSTELAVTADSSEIVAGKEPGGAAGTMPLVGIPVKFRNPEVIPTIIFILVLYFGFRFTIEWRQCPESIRDDRTTKVDAGVAYAIGLAAVALFIVQRITELRLAEIFGDEGMRFFAVGLCIAFIIGMIIQKLIDDGKLKHLTGLLITLAISFAVYGMIAIFGDKGPSIFPDLVASVVGIVFGSLFMIILGDLIPRKIRLKLTKRMQNKADVEQTGDQK